MAEKNPTSFRLTPTALSLLAKIAAYDGLSQSGVIEVLIRRESERLGIKGTK
jgi:hypothetical protein